MQNPIEEDINKFEGGRPLYTFNVPEKLAGREDEKITSVSLVELTAEEEMRAGERASLSLLKNVNECVKESIRRVNGRPVASHDGSVDRVWNRMDPRLRNLLLAAYNRLHQPERSDIEAFLESVSVS